MIGLCGVTVMCGVMCGDDTSIVCVSSNANSGSAVVLSTLE